MCISTTNSSKRSPSYTAMHGTHTVVGLNKKHRVGDIKGTLIYANGIPYNQIKTKVKI